MNDDFNKITLILENDEAKREIIINLDENIYKLRISKAIEYIENDLSHATSNGKLHRKHLIDILKGVDKE